LAWLHSTPKNPKSNKLQNKTEQRDLTRGEKIEQNGGSILYPYVGEASYLLDYWQGAGMVCPSGMGPTALTSCELESWQRCSGIQLTPWEFQTIRDMSRAYINQSAASDDLNCPPPYIEQVLEFDRNIVAKKIGDALKLFTRK